MEFKTKFNVGDKVYVVYTPYESEQCPTCKLYHPKKSKDISRVLELTVTGIGVRCYPDWDLGTIVDYNLSKNPEDVDMVDEHDLFATREEAEESIKTLVD